MPDGRRRNSPAATPSSRPSWPRRSQNPKGQEAIQLPASRAIVYSLHAGRWRALTWWEPELGIVWLLGAGYHRSGERSDAYATLKRRDEADELFPTEQDYLDLEPDPADFVQAVAREAPELVAGARQAPGEEIRADLAGVLDVSVMAVVVEGEGQRLEEIWVGFSMPPKGPIPPHPAWLLAAAAAFFPGANVEDLHYGGDFPRPERNRHGEIIVCWQP